MGRVTQNTVVVNNLSCCLSVFVPTCVPFGQSVFGYFVRSLSVCCIFVYCLFVCLTVSLSVCLLMHSLYIMAYNLMLIHVAKTYVHCLFIGLSVICLCVCLSIHICFYKPTMAPLQ